MSKIEGQAQVWFANLCVQAEKTLAELAKSHGYDFDPQDAWPSPKVLSRDYMFRRKDGQHVVVRLHSDSTVPYSVISIPAGCDEGAIAGLNMMLAAMERP